MSKALLLGCGRRRERQIWLAAEKEAGLHEQAKSFTGSELVTLDIDPAVNPDVVWDLEKLPLPFPDDTFDEIHAYEVLEHTGTQGDWRFFFAQFGEFYRILKPQGMFYATVPDFKADSAWGDPGHKRCLPPMNFVFLNQEIYKTDVGKSTMTDYRPWWKGDFQGVLAEVKGTSLYLAMQALKPGRG